MEQEKEDIHDILNSTRIVIEYRGHILKCQPRTLMLLQILRNNMLQAEELVHGNRVMLEPGTSYALFKLNIEKVCKIIGVESSSSSVEEENQKIDLLVYKIKHEGSVIYNQLADIYNEIANKTIKEIHQTDPGIDFTPLLCEHIYDIVSKTKAANKRDMT